MIAEELFSDPDDEANDDEYDEEGNLTSASYACEDCDYRWDVMNETTNSYGELDDDEVVCPMCGSTHVTQI